MSKVAVPAVASILAGTVLEVPIVALVFGLAGGLVALSWLPPMPPLRRVYSVVASTVTAGAIGPLFAAHIHSASVSPTVEMIAVSFLTGAGFQVILQTAIAAVVARIKQLGGDNRGRE